MVSTPLELSFDYKSHVYPMLQKFTAGNEQTTGQTQRLEELLDRLEEERLKIDAFKRELPLCMQLLTNAMEVSRQQLHLERSKTMLEEFIPLKNNTDIQSSKAIDEAENCLSAADKSSWMVSAQLWNQENDETAEGPQSLLPYNQETEIKLTLSGGKQRINGGGAFVPFSPKRDHRHHEEGFPELALASSHGHKEELGMVTAEEEGESSNSKRCGGEKEQVNNNNSNNTSQAQRKARRCWSPELHRRFVNALHMLGGSHVATPKQIRELMKVDGLTNDEVKSHLQKYRLHTRRSSPSRQATVPAPPQVVVLGGIWVPQEYAAAAAQTGSPSSASLYGAHGPAATHTYMAPPFCSAAPSQVAGKEIYPAIAPPPQPLSNANYQIHHHPGLHHHHRHQQIYLYNAEPPSAQGNGSPESDIHNTDDDPSESIEDVKSDSARSWKADSGGENDEERRSRVEGEESNGINYQIN